LQGMWRRNMKSKMRTSKISPLGFDQCINLQAVALQINNIREWRTW
jgi:hypothetical protein